MTSQLEVFGPFDIPFGLVGSVKTISKAEVTAFWAKDDAEQFKTKHGVYIFAMRAAKGFTPWYVGRAGTGFVKEIFTSDKVLKYREVFDRGTKGSPVMFFVTKGGSRNKVGAKIIGEVEQSLIVAAGAKNSELVNVHHNKDREWCIKGVMYSSPGKPTTTARQFKAMMGMK